MTIPAFTATDVFDKVRVYVSGSEYWDADDIGVYNEGERVSRLRLNRYSLTQPELLKVIDRRVEAGTVDIEWFTLWGIVQDADVPDWMRPYINLRDPFIRERATPLPTPTTVEQRRQQVTEWALRNTTPGMFIQGSILAWENPPSNRVRPKVVIWWHFVLMNLAAAQDDDWLEHVDVWPAIERNIEISAQDFFEHCAEQLWNGPAGYMEALSRIYKAGEYLTTAPTQVITTPPALSKLHAGSDEAKRTLFGIVV